MNTTALQATLIVDEHLNVKERLAQLRAWREEWKCKDDQLAAEVAQLDPSKPHDILRGAQIASLRHRLQVQRVKVPLELSAAVIRRIGYERIRHHLSQQFAQLTGDEGLCWLSNFRFIMTPDLRRLHNKIARMHSYSALGQQRNVLLGGPSGMGKTTYLNWYTCNHPPKIKAEHSQVTVIKIDAPIHKSSAKPFFQRLLLECGEYYSNRGDEETLLMQLITYMQQCSVEVVIVDEIEHMIRPHLRRRLLELSNLTPGLPIICASCHPLRWIAGDSEIISRWNDHFELCLYTGDRLCQLLACIELLLPFTQPSSLAEYEIVNRTKSGKVIAGLARLIEQWTGGVLRDIMTLLVEASGHALLHSLPCLTPGLLAETWQAIQANQGTDF
jgi:hypothetical protein